MKPSRKLVTAYVEVDDVQAKPHCGCTVTTCHTMVFQFMVPGNTPIPPCMFCLKPLSVIREVEA